MGIVTRKSVTLEVGTDFRYQVSYKLCNKKYHLVSLLVLWSR